MKNGIVIAGNLIVDHVKMCDTFPRPGMLTNIRDVSDCIGGCAGNTLCDLGKIDPSVPLKCVGKIGEDADGKYVLETLEKHGVDSRFVKTCGAPTSFTDVMTAIDTNERTFFQMRGANAEFGIDDIPFEKLGADIFHIGYALLLDKFDTEDEEYGTVLARALAYARKAGMKTSMDVVSENSDRFVRLVSPCLKYCDYLIINEIEASLTTGMSVRKKDGSISSEKVGKVIEKLFELGVGELVCIHAPEGGWCCVKKDGKLKTAYHDSLYLPKGYIKGKVGAGDAFCAGMLYSIYKGFDPEYSLRVAGACSGANLSEKNSIDGLRSFDELMKLDELYGRVKPAEYC